MGNEESTEAIIIRPWFWDCRKNPFDKTTKPIWKEYDFEKSAMLETAYCEFKSGKSKNEIVFLNDNATSFSRKRFI